MISCVNRKAAVECAEDYLKWSEEIGLPLTIAIKPEKLGGYSVSGATSSWLDGLERKLRIFFGLPTITLTKNIPDG